MGNANIMPAKKPFGCSLSTYIRLRKKIIGDALKGQPITKPTAPDCADCRACCRFDANEARAGDDLSLFVAATQGGKLAWLLPQRENGDCSYLDGSGCSVYARRPTLCRVFDCRDYVATGALPDKAGKVYEAALRWDLRPAIQGPDDRRLYIALRLMTQESFRSGNRSAEEVAGISILYYDRHLPMAREIDRKLAALGTERRFEEMESLFRANPSCVR